MAREQAYFPVFSSNAMGSSRAFIYVGIPELETIRNAIYVYIIHARGLSLCIFIVFGRGYLAFLAEINNDLLLLKIYVRRRQRGTPHWDDATPTFSCAMVWSFRSALCYCC